MIPSSWTCRDAEIVIPARRTDVIADARDGEIVFADPTTSETFHLNHTAREVWDACDGATTTLALARRLTKRYEVPFDVVLDDIEQVLLRLAEAGLLAKEAAA